MQDKELIESLRLWNRDDAADRIEALVRREEKLGVLLSAAGSVADAMKARAERLEAALRGLMMHEPNHPDTLWQEARAALKGADHE